MSLPQHETIVTNTTPEKKDILVECKELLQLLEKSLQNLKTQSSEHKEWQAMQSRLQSLITMIESNHPTLPTE